MPELELYRGPEEGTPGCDDPECRKQNCTWAEQNAYNQIDCEDCQGTGWNQETHEPCEECWGHGYFGYSW